MTKRINSTELTQQQTVIVLCVIYLSVCLLYLRFYIERTWFCSIYYDYVLGGSLMHEVEHIKPQMTRAARVLLGRAFIKTCYYYVIYICFIFRLVHARIIYALNVNTNLKRIIHGSAERLFGHIFHAIPETRMMYRILMRPQAHRLIFKYLIIELILYLQLHIFSFLAREALPSFDRWWFTEIRILTHALVITQLLNTTDAGQQLLI